MRTADVARPKVVEKEASYTVGDGRVFVAVDVGLAQDGVVTMHLDTQPLGKSPAPVAPRDLGSGAEVAGKLLTVETLVRDQSATTNKMIVTVQLTGGPAPKPVESEDSVSNQGDAILFRTFVLFRKAQS